MLLRRVINAEQCYPGTHGCRWNLDLECGHSLQWVYVGKRLPSKKRCHFCETIAGFAVGHPHDYCQLVGFLSNVPADDRIGALDGWVAHCLRSYDFADEFLVWNRT